MTTRTLPSTVPYKKERIPEQTRYFYIRLESESSTATDEDTESVHSVQNHETDCVRDTSDTDAYEVEIQYDIATTSGSDEGDGFFDFSESDSDPEQDQDIMAIAAAAVVCDSSFETFVTDAEDSDNSLQEDNSLGLRDYWTCIQCKAQNDNPQFRFCPKCFQDRKTLFPPRPRRNKKRASPVKLDALQSCLSGLSQDSGIGSSQSFPSLNLDQIVVPNHLNSSKDETTPTTSNASRKRQLSESSLSEEYEYEKRPKRLKPSSTPTIVDLDETNNERTANKSVGGPLPETKEKCIVCHSKMKDSVFLHGKNAHMCCCYGCAMKTWKKMKCCPICKRKVSQVARVFS